MIITKIQTKDVLPNIKTNYAMIENNLQSPRPKALFALVDIAAKVSVTREIWSCYSARF